MAGLPRVVLARQLHPLLRRPWPCPLPLLLPHPRALSLSSRLRDHEDPLGIRRKRRFPVPEGGGLPRSDEPPRMPARGALPPRKRRIPHVEKVVVVASGKGGVGKSTVAANLAVAMSLEDREGGDVGRRRRKRVGLLDLDIFGPSVPTLMGLEGVGEPLLTSENALVPLENHGVKCMSIGFLLAGKDAPVAWRGMMVMKAVQQLLFDVDWRGASPSSGSGSGSDGEVVVGVEGFGLDVLVIDMPPGTGDVALSVGQLVEVDGAVVVSTPQDVALLDVRRGVAMFRAVSIPILGLLLNMAHFICPTCATPHAVFGAPDAFRALAAASGLPVLAEVPLEPAASASADAGRPLSSSTTASATKADEAFRTLAKQVLLRL